MTAPIKLEPIAQKIDSTWTIPGSKSLTNRAFILAALAEGCSILEGVLSSDDTVHMRHALTEMGVVFTDISKTSVAVRGGLSTLHAPSGDLFIGNSGTSVRFLSALAALIPGPITFTGDEHMAKRPIADLQHALVDLGISVDCPSSCPPITIHGGKYNGGSVTIPGDKSSQYFSALMLSGGIARQPLHIEIKGNLVSRPYVNMTIQMVHDFGGKITETENGFTVHPCRAYRSCSYHIEPDASAASYAFALAAAHGGKIKVPHINAECLQGDIQFIDVLAKMGAQVERTPHYITVTGPQQLDGIEVDMHHISDTVMTLAAIAPLCKGPVRIYNIANIRIKETDRLIACVNELRKLGQEVHHGDDWLEIIPKPITPANIECYSDHRMAMSFAILGCVVPGVSITDPDCVAKTYPDFWIDLKSIYTQQAQAVNW